MDTQKAHKLLSDFFACGKKEAFSRRSTIIPYNEEITRGYLVIEGCVKVLSHTRSGNQRIHYLYGNDDFFPVTWMFGKTRFPIEFCAFTDVTVISRPHEEIKAFFEAQPLSLLVVIEQQSSAYSRIINLNMGNAQQRVAYRMVTLGQKFGKLVDDHYVIDMHITMQDLADMVRLTRESVGKVVADFERRGYLVMGRRTTIVYYAPLQLMAED